jgi:predicted component of type VI protein secretion system
MPKKELELKLRALHDELAATDALDPTLRKQLRHVADDIEQLLDTGRGEEQQDDDLEDRARQAAVDFEAEHPRLAHVLSEIADTLTKLGI